MINLVVISNFCVVFLLKIQHETSKLGLAHFFEVYSTLLLLYMYT